MPDLKKTYSKSEIIEICDYVDNFFDSLSLRDNYVLECVTNKSGLYDLFTNKKEMYNGAPESFKSLLYSSTYYGVNYPLQSYNNVDYEMIKSFSSLNKYYLFFRKTDYGKELILDEDGCINLPVKHIVVPSYNNLSYYISSCSENCIVYLYNSELEKRFNRSFETGLVINSTDKELLNKIIYKNTKLKVYTTILNFLMNMETIKEYTLEIIISRLLSQYTKERLAISRIPAITNILIIQLAGTSKEKFINFNKKYIGDVFTDSLISKRYMPLYKAYFYMLKSVDDDKKCFFLSTGTPKSIPLYNFHNGDISIIRKIFGLSVINGTRGKSKNKTFLFSEEKLKTYGIAGEYNSFHYIDGYEYLFGLEKCSSCSSTAPSDNLIYNKENKTVCGKCANINKDLVSILPYNSNALNYFKFKGKQTGKIKRYFGIECELEVKKGIDLLEAKKKITLDVINHCIMKYDGSLRNGIELCSAPSTYDVHLLEFKSIFESVKKYLKSASTAGVHIHVSKEGISNTHLYKMQYFLNNAHNREFIFHVANRRFNNYCKSHVVNKNLDDFTSEVLTREKYVILNLMKKQTIEFRLFNSTTNIEDLGKYLDFVRAVIDWTESIPIVNKLYYEDLINYTTKYSKIYPYLVSSIKKFKPSKSKEVKK